MIINSDATEGDNYKRPVNRDASLLDAKQHPSPSDEIRRYISRRIRLTQRTARFLALPPLDGRTVVPLLARARGRPG